MAEARCQNKQKTPPPPPPLDKKALEAAIQDRNFKEAEALREVIVLLSAANKDYDGHRAKAMKHVDDVIKELDKRIEKNGTPQQKDATDKENKAKDAIKEAEREAPPVKENQVTSDGQLKAADVLLRKVAVTMTQNPKQPVLLKQVEKAIEEIEAALKVN